MSNFFDRVKGEAFVMEDLYSDLAEKRLKAGAAM